MKPALILVALIAYALAAVVVFLCSAAKASGYQVERRTVTASWYGREAKGKPMANGKPFNPDKLTCASWDYPLGTKLKVSYKGKSCIAEVSDRGPSRKLLESRQLDLSHAAFKQLADPKVGLLEVEIYETHR